jgi:hypothetical protein
MWLPVVYDARGEARKRIARAASSEAPGDPAGCVCSRELAAPGGPVLRLVFARLEAAAPLARLDQADQDAVDAHALRREFGGHGAHQVQQAGTRGRGGDHVRLGLARQQRVGADDGRIAQHRALCRQLRQEGARGVDHREELQLELFGPGRVVGVGEGGDTALPGVVDQHGGRAERGLAGGGKGAHRAGVEHVAGLREEPGVRVLLAQARHGGVEPLGIAAAQRNGRAAGQQQLDRGQADARRATGDHGHAARQCVGGEEGRRRSERHGLCVMPRVMRRAAAPPWRCARANS